MQRFFPPEVGLVTEALTRPLFYVVFGSTLLWAFTAASHNTPWLAALALLALLLTLLTVIDLKHMLLPDILTLPGLALGLALVPLLTPHTMLSSLLGAALGYGLFAALHYGFYALRGYHGLGYGDVKLMAMLGAWVGVLNLPLVLLIASFSALPVFIGHRLFGQGTSQTPLPFGPFLALGGWVAALHGSTLWNTIFTMRMAVVNWLI